MTTGAAVPAPRFQGRALPSDPDRSLAQWLGRRGVPLLQRSIRYHRPRAPFCGLGYCTGCLVRVNGVPNVRACRFHPGAGDRIETENAWPSPRYDVLGGLDLVFRHGIDTLRGFTRPRWATPLYHRVVRRLAGYGAPPTPGPDARPSSGRRIDTDVLVVGAGRSGSAAAHQLTERGVDHVVVDRDTIGSPGPDRALVRTEVVFLPLPLPGATHRFRAVAVTEGREGLLLSARSVIVATGGYDANVWAANIDRPGVMTADGALRLTVAGEAPPFHRAVVFGGGPRAVELLDRFGDAVEAVVAPGSIDAEVARRASELGVPLLPRTLLLGVQGRRRVRAVETKTRGGGPRQVLAADALLLAHRRLPNVQLLFQAGARMAWNEGIAAYRPELTPRLESTVSGLFVAGEPAGFVAPEAAVASGVAAAAAAAGDTGVAPTVAPPPASDLPGYYRELLPYVGRSGKWVACACEDVLLSEVQEASRRGYRGIEVVKRYTGVGTGLCQGRYCVPEALVVLSILEGRPPVEVGTITQRPPVAPTRLSALAALPEEPVEGGVGG